MLRHLMLPCFVLCLSVGSIRADDKTVSAAPTTENAESVAAPAEVQQLEGKVVKIYHDVDLLGEGKPSVLHTEYLALVLEKAGVTVQRRRSLQEKKDEPKPDVVIFGEMTEPKFAPGELADPFIAAKAKGMRREIQKYKDAKPKLEQDAAAGGARVIKFEDVAATLGFRVKKAQMIAALDARAQEALETVIPDLKADQIGMSDIVDFLRDASGANIFVNWRALQAAGVNRNAPITLEVRKMPLAKALDELLYKAAGGEEGKLGYEVQEGVIVISTAEELKKKDL